MEIIAIRYIRTCSIDFIDTESDEPEVVGYDNGQIVSVVDINYYRLTHVPVGCLIITDTGVLSWSACAEGDQFSYAKAKEIALERAKKRKKGDFTLTESEISHFPDTRREDVIAAISDLVYSYNKRLLK